tara:strand:- start:42 stop:671 length:630 start_codon:yes stop_codon:yes gene_type:complete
MANNNTQHLISIYNSRNNILEILEERKFDIINYSNISINELGVLYENNQLDMLVEDKNNKKVYIKYYLNKLIKPQNIYDIVEDLFNLENLLDKKDDLIIIIKDEPNDTLLETIKNIWMSENIYISLLNIKRLQYNVLKHVMVPKHTILNNDEVLAMKKKYNILNNEQLPTISYYSPVSLVIGLRPDNIVKIDRNSKTALSSEYFRICKF